MCFPVSVCFISSGFLPFPVISRYFLPIPLSKYGNRHYLDVTYSLKHSCSSDFGVMGLILLVVCVMKCL